MTDWIIDSELVLTKGAHSTEALRFFVFEFPKVMLLLTLIIFFVGIIRTYFTPERTRKALEGKKTFTGNVMAATLGIVTPFCSCSAIPLFLGFVESGVPLGGGGVRDIASTDVSPGGGPRLLGRGLAGKHGFNLR